jgi:hypothetical protein
VNSIFETNQRALEQRFLVPLDEFVKPQEAYEVYTTQALIKLSPHQIPNIYFESHSRPMSVYSDVNPLADISAITSTLAGKPISHVVTLGLNFGFVLEEIINQNEDLVHLLVIEPDATLFVEQLKHMDISHLLANEKIIFLVGKSPERSAQIAGHVLNIRGADMKHWAFALLPSVLPLYTGFAQDFVGLFQTAMSKQKLSQSTLGNLGIKFIQNYIENMHAVPKASYVIDYKDKFKDMPCIIASAGPSLEKQLPLLKQIENKIIIIAVGAAMKTLKKYGISPHFIVTIDPLDKNLKYFEDVEFTREVLVAPIVSASNVLRHFKGPLIMAQYNPKFDELSEKTLGRMGYLDSGGSVANSTYSFAKHIGVNKIIFIGQDLAHTGGQSHADGHLNKNEKTLGQMRKDPNMFRIKGYYGDEVYAPATLDAFRSWFEHHIKKDTHIDVINCTEGGALIQGAVNMPFTEVATSYLAEPDINLDLNVDASSKKAKKMNVKKFMQKDLRETQDVETILAQSITRIKKVVESTSSDPIDSAVKQAANSLDSFKQYLIKNEDLASPHINLLWANSLTELGKVQFDDDSSPKEILSGFLPPLEKLKTHCNTVNDFLIKELQTLSKA